MALKLIYLMFAKLPGWMLLQIRSDTTKDIEILVLRHQLAVLQRRTPRPRLCWADRALTAALARLLPARRRRGLIVTPSTIPRWHRQLLTRRWTAPPVRRGRPAIPAGVRALMPRLATENPVCTPARRSTVSSAARNTTNPSRPRPLQISLANNR